MRGLWLGLLPVIATRPARPTTRKAHAWSESRTDFGPAKPLAACAGTDRPIARNCRTGCGGPEVADRACLARVGS